MHTDSIRFHEKLIVRSPSRPFDMNFSKESILLLLRDRAFVEAIYIASPDLYKESINWMIDPNSKEEKKQRKLLVSLAKYYVRMNTRSTPFGLFSGCSMAAWQKTEQAPPGTGCFSRKTRLDMHFLCSLSEYVETIAGVKEQLVYYPNSSLYNLGHTMRYVEYAYVNGYRSYRITSVQSSTYLVNLLRDSKDGLSYPELLSKLQLYTGASEQEAVEFLSELISSQVFVSELEPTITASDFSSQLSDKLARLAGNLPDCGQLNEIWQALGRTIRLLHELDVKGTNDVAAYQAITDILKTIGVPFEESKLFQVDLVTGGDQLPVVHESLQEQLKEAIGLCMRLSEAPNHHLLNRFKNRFRARYENSEQPLLEVLDVECGVGFGDHEVQDNSGNFDDVLFGMPKTEDGIQWTEGVKYLFEKLVSVNIKNHVQIELDPSEILAIRPDLVFNMPPTQSVMFRRFTDPDGAEKIVYENCSGISAISLMGRFAHADPAIKTFCKQIADAEQDLNKGIRFAEIVHLPERRIGNILLHPVFRESEIPYLAQSSPEASCKLSPENLLVSVQGERVVLRDRLSGDEIIPRLSSAHNFSRESLPVYHFLASLQNQGLNSSAGFSWGPLARLFRFYPRVTYKHIILSLATWRLTAEDLKPLLAAGQEEVMDKMREFVTNWNLPDAFMVSEGDNELLVYVANPLSILTFLDLVKNKTVAWLKEFPCITGGEFFPDAAAYGKQYVAAILRKDPAVLPVSQSGRILASTDKDVRRFVPGSEWLYVKLYCGLHEADNLIREVFTETVSNLRNVDLIDKWFFIRYADPEFHLRLRLHVKEKVFVSKVMTQLYEVFHPYIGDFRVWKLQFDTYDRELERYGHNTIEIAESYFCADSEAVSGLLNCTGTTVDSTIRTLWLMKAIDDLLTAYLATPESRLKLIEQLRNSFAKELNAGKVTNTHIDTKYRKMKGQIEKTLQGKDGMNESEVFQLLNLREAAIKIQAAEVANIYKEGMLRVSLEGILSGFIHMTCNRVFATHARQQEFIIYDFLHRYYKSRLAIQAGTKPSEER